MPLNVLTPESRNTLAIQDQYGQFQVGGPIGINDIKGAIARDPFMQGLGGVIADIVPGSAQTRSVDRINALQEDRSLLEERPIANVLNMAEQGTEYAGLAADAFPALKGLGIAASSLIPFMMRRAKPLTGLAKYANTMKQGGSIGDMTILKRNGESVGD